MKQLYKSVENPQDRHFAGGRGGGTQFYGQNDVVDIWAFLTFRGDSLQNEHFPCIAWEKSWCNGVEDLGSLISVPLALRGYSLRAERPCFKGKSPVGKVSVKV